MIERVLIVRCLFENENWSTVKIDVRMGPYIALTATTRQRQMRITMYCVALHCDIVKRNESHLFCLKKSLASKVGLFFCRS